MKHIELWPPLSQIQREIEGDQMPNEADVADPDRPVICNAVLTGSRQGLEGSLAPIRDWVDRRCSALAGMPAPAWAEGFVMGLPVGRTLHGVLLDRCVGVGKWVGWMTAPECDWACAFDVLLEPEDEPFDPMCGVVQTWNSVTVRAMPLESVRLLGRLSPRRLAAVRAVHSEYRAARDVAVPPELGRIALRVVSGEFTVLTGAPLAAQDPRRDYQAIYRRAGSRLSEAMGA